MKENKRQSITCQKCQKTSIRKDVSVGIVRDGKIVYPKKFIEYIRSNYIRYIITKPEKKINVYCWECWCALIQKAFVYFSRENKDGSTNNGHGEENGAK